MGPELVAHAVGLLGSLQIPKTITAKNSKQFCNTFHLPPSGIPIYGKCLRSCRAGFSQRNAINCHYNCLFVCLFSLWLFQPLESIIHLSVIRQHMSGEAPWAVGGLVYRLVLHFLQKYITCVLMKTFSTPIGIK